MARKRLLDVVKERVIVCDGGMGTQLIEAGLEPGACGVIWNVEHPDAVEQVHRRYAEAGCDLLTSNTFQGTRTALAMHGLSDRVSELNQAGARVARIAAGEDRWVLADVGPFGGFLEPLGETSESELTDLFIEQLQGLYAGGADVALIETMSDANEVRVAVQAAKQVADWPVIASYCFENQGGTYRTMMGLTADAALDQALAAGADIVGTNCGTAMDLEDYVKLADELVAAAKGAPVIVQPNAGAPQVVDGKTVHPATVEQMAALAVKLKAAGVKIIGGCCGTNPEMLQVMAGSIKG